MIDKQPDYSRTYKFVLFIYSSIAGLIGLIFNLNSFSVVKINTDYSTGLGLFLIFTSFIGFLAFLTKNKILKLFNGYLRGIHILVCILLIYTCIKYVRPSDEFQKDFLGKYIDALMTGDSSKIDDVQNALKCCASNYTFESMESINLKNIKLNQLKLVQKDDVKIEPTSSKLINFFDDLIPDIPKVNDPKYKYYLKHEEDDGEDLMDKIVYPKSCCPKLDDLGECHYRNIYNVTCNLAYQFKVYSYKVSSILVLVASFGFEFSLLYMFKKDLHLFNSN